MDYKLLVLSSLWTVTYPVTSVMNLHLMARQAADEKCIMQIDEGKLYSYVQLYMKELGQCDKSIDYLIAIPIVNLRATFVGGGHRHGSPQAVLPGYSCRCGPGSLGGQRRGAEDKLVIVG